MSGSGSKTGGRVPKGKAHPDDKLRVDGMSLVF